MFCQTTAYAAIYRFVKLLIAQLTNNVDHKKTFDFPSGFHRKLICIWLATREIILSIVLSVMQERVLAGIAAALRTWYGYDRRSTRWATRAPISLYDCFDCMVHLVLSRPSPPQRSDFDMASLWHSAQTSRSLTRWALHSLSLHAALACFTRRYTQ